MSGEEREGQRRSVFGLDVEHCDICGAPTPVSQLQIVDSDSRLAEHTDAERICPDCVERILSGELGIENIMPEDEDRPGRPDW